MLGRWSRAAGIYSRVFPATSHLYEYPGVNFSSKIATVLEADVADAVEKNNTANAQVNLKKIFWSKPCSLALPANSPLRAEDPKYEGIKHIIFKLLLFYSKQSKSIRQSNVIYKRVLSQVDKPDIYNVFSLEKNFKTTFSLLVIHMWLCLRRLKEEGKEGVQLGQYVYELYNHDLELRVSRAGVNLLLHKWVKELEKIFYGNIVAYDAAMLPEAKQEELQNVIWRNVFSDDGSSPVPNDAALLTVQAMSRYVRRESNCLSLTDKEAVFLGNFMFTPLGNQQADCASRVDEG